MNIAAPCPCGSAAPADRLHHFWECAAARAVRDELSAQLPAACRPVTRAQVWLMQAPDGVHEGVWRVVCLAAAEAMLKGKKLLGGWAAAEAQGGPASPGAAAAGRRAVALFWALLDDFAFAPWEKRVDKGTRDDRGFSLPDEHPFFRGDSSDLRVYRV
jgi:hypothetical protein